MWRLISLDCFCNNLTCKIYCQSIITNIFVVLFINLSNLLKGSNDFENDISISCSELPDHFQCTLNSSSFYYELLGARPAQFFCSVPLPNLVWWLVWLASEPLEGLKIFGSKDYSKSFFWSRFCIYYCQNLSRVGCN